MSSEAVARPVPLPLRLGRRTVASLTRKLVRLTVPLAQARAGTPLALPSLPPRADGYYLRALPAGQVAALAGDSGMRTVVRQAYPRHFADLGLGWDGYLATFSAKTRSALKRKSRKLAERNDGALDIRTYRSPSEIAEFHREGRALSARTYQEKLLDAGLPDDLAQMQALAERDQVRAWLLFVDDAAIAYLYAPAAGTALRYEHLGYDPAFAEWSPGSVLQFEAMRLLMDEGRFSAFDFTEGDGQHKRQFATGAIDSVDLLLLRPTFANRATGAALTGFDRAVEVAKKVVRR